MIFIIVNYHIDNFDPTMQSFRRTNKEVIFVEYFKHISFQLLGKSMSFFYDGHGNLTSTVYKHSILAFILYNCQNSHKYFSSLLHKSGLALTVENLQKLIANSFQNQKCINSAVNYCSLWCQIVEIHIRCFCLLNFSYLIHINFKY